MAGEEQKSHPKSTNPANELPNLQFTGLDAVAMEMRQHDLLSSLTQNRIHLEVRQVTRTLISKVGPGRFSDLDEFVRDISLKGFIFQRLLLAKIDHFIESPSNAEGWQSLV